MLNGHLNVIDITYIRHNNHPLLCIIMYCVDNQIHLIEICMFIFWGHKYMIFINKLIVVNEYFVKNITVIRIGNDKILGRKNI